MKHIRLINLTLKDGIFCEVYANKKGNGLITNPFHCPEKKGNE